MRSVLLLLVGVAIGIAGYHVASVTMDGGATASTEDRTTAVRSAEGEVAPPRDLSPNPPASLQGRGEPAGTDTTALLEADSEEGTQARWAAVAEAHARIRPIDHRKPFVEPEDGSTGAWGTLRTVQQKLRDEDAEAWVGWVAEAQVTQLQSQLPPDLTLADRVWLEDLFHAFHEEQTAAFLASRATWEDPSITTDERNRRYHAWIRELDRAADKRDGAIRKRLSEAYPKWWEEVGSRGRLILPAA